MAYYRIVTFSLTNTENKKIKLPRRRLYPLVLSYCEIDTCYVIRDTTSQMVAVYDVVEIAGISYGMISKTLAYDLNRNHTM